MPLDRPDDSFPYPQYHGGMRGFRQASQHYEEPRYPPMYGNVPFKHRAASLYRGPGPRTRLDNSLGELTKKFICMIQSSPSRELDLNDAATELNV